MPLLIPVAIAGVSGLVGWGAGFFQSDSIKRLSWVALLLLAALVAFWVWVNR